MMLEKVLLDVNVPMYAAGKEHRYKEPCAWIMGEIAEDRIRAVIDTEIVQEILYRYPAIRRWELAVSVSQNLLVIVTEIMPVQETHVRLVVDLFPSYGPTGIPPRDILHAAVMMLGDVKRIIFTDSHFDQIEGIERIDPLTLFNEGRR